MTPPVDDAPQGMGGNSGSREPSPASGLGPSGFDPARVALGLYRVHWKSGGHSLASVYMDAKGGRWIAPTNWMAPGPLSVEGWAAVERLEPLLEMVPRLALDHAVEALRTVGDDYPGSSCHHWCHLRADEAEEIASAGAVE